MFLLNKGQEQLSSSACAKLNAFRMFYTPNINVVLQTSTALIYLLHSQTDSKGDVGG
jgi:hypothetical protein